MSRAFHLLTSIACLVVACGDSGGDTTIDTLDTLDTGDGVCIPVEPGHPYGPCDGDCGGPGNVCYKPAAGADVCAKACESDEDCAAVPWCTPDDAAWVCHAWHWCVVPCDAANGLCPTGMVCDQDVQPEGTGLGICVWPKP